MQNLAGLGISSKAVEELSQEEISNITHDPEEHIPVLEGYRTIRSNDGEIINREPEYGTIKRDRWERLLTTQDALENVGGLLEGEFAREDPRISLVFTGMESSPTEFGVEVHTDYGNKAPDNRKTRAGLEDLLPTEVEGSINKEEIQAHREGIPVKVVGSDVQQTAYIGENHADIPGGAPIETETDSGIEIGTTTAVFNDNYEGYGWVTATHVVDESIDDVVYQRTDNDPLTSEDPFGIVDEKVFQQNGDIDCAFIDMDSNQDEDQAFYIAEPDYSDPRDIYASGIINDETLRNNTDGTYTVYMQGSSSTTSGRVQTSVTGTKANWTGDVYAVITDEKSYGGDSGGPIFRLVDTDSGQEARICGTVKGAHDSNEDGNYNDTLSTTAETVENKLGGNF
jgi:hypothetical protein